MLSKKINDLIEEQRELLNELDTYKTIHRYSIVKAKLVKYYKDLEQGQINIPDFLRNDSPEKLADRDIQEMLTIDNGTNEFLELYDKVWNEVAEFLP